MKAFTVKQLSDDECFLFDFELAMYWMPSSQADKMKDWLRMPIRNHEKFAKIAQGYHLDVQKIPPEANVCVRDSRFSDMLNDLCKAGEDVDRLQLWLSSMIEGHKSLGMRPRACEQWIRILKSWVSDGSLMLLCKLLGIDKKFAASYCCDVAEPNKELRRKKRVLEKQWREPNSSRTSFDDCVDEIYFRNLRSTPVRFFRFDVERRLHREWWRSARNLLLANQLEGLLEEMTERLGNDPTPELVSWENVMDLDDAFTIDLIPVFETVARDW